MQATADREITTMTASTKKYTIGTDPGDAAHEMFEKGAAAGHKYTTAFGTATVAGLRTAFDIQNSFITAGRSMADATVLANAKLADKLAETFKGSQVEATKLVEASAKLATDTLEVRS
jgi:hypothetical protein